MRKKLFYCLLFVGIVGLQNASGQIDHWEALILNNQNRSYILPSAEPNSNWTSIGYNAASWSMGIGGIGFGDGDDGTVTPAATSIYQRLEFNVVDVSVLQNLVLLMDYDDGFVVYLNGEEVARANISGTPPAFNAFADGQHEAEVYLGGTPTAFQLDPIQVSNLLQNGPNVLALQVHNVNPFSSDVSSLLWLLTGVTDASANYSPAPSWFTPPLIFTSSDLPIVSISTGGVPIVDDPKIDATMRIIDNGPGMRNNLTDSANGYDGHIGIEQRGSTSSGFPKKGYGLETRTVLGDNNNVRLLDMPKENDWVLHNPYSDKTLMRNALTYQLGAALGQYAPRVRFCELVLNGSYRGVYVLMEKIKKDNDRVDIATLDHDDLLGDSVTGGYIIKIDKFTGGGNGWQSPYTPFPGANPTVYQYHYPKFDLILPEQADYIESYVTDFEDAIAGPNYTDSVLGYHAWIDVESFVDYFIMQELSRNVDGYRLSAFFHKDKASKGGKLKAGPLWDFNIAWGNADYCNGGLTTGWAHDFDLVCPQDGGMIPFYWKKLLSDQNFLNHVRCRWEQLRQPGMPLNNLSLINRIDSMATLVDEAKTRNFEQWPILSSYVWPNAGIYDTYAGEIQNLKSWMQQRVIWIDNNLPPQTGSCSTILSVEEEEKSFDNLIAYPNPAQEHTYVELPNGFASHSLQVKIVDLRGRVQQVNYNRTADLVKINTASLAAGIYTILITDQQRHWTARLAKR